jgi:ankyrin repeat protein
MVSLFLDQGVNPQVQDHLGEAPLSRAIIAKNWAQKVSALLDLGADPNTPNNDGVTPLVRTIKKGQV